MRILITNDDAIHAPGIEALKIASAVTDDVWIVAPDLDNSGASHSLTPNELLRVCELAQRRYGVKGTPTDCVIMGVRLNEICLQITHIEGNAAVRLVGSVQ
jgi:5'/3'-nucleotidase